MRAAESNKAMRYGGQTGIVFFHFMDVVPKGKAFVTCWL